VIVPFTAGASDSLYSPGLKDRLFAPTMIQPSEGWLVRQGYNVNDIAAVKRATADQNAVVRSSALHLLAYQIRRQAMPALKAALDDADPFVRAAAARLLGVLGDLSGLDRMREDLAEFAEQQEKGPAEDPGTRQGNQVWYLRSRRTRLWSALQAAQVLAEFGDTSGYELAAGLLLRANIPAFAPRASQFSQNLTDSRRPPCGLGAAIPKASCLLLHSRRRTDTLWIALPQVSAAK
jgi:hypothetical protein